ncbi:hypothetical protein CspHIS471_0507770 [Cutaneotrichosporon sp. HIS471]|nr:hypothetical protein CspHIS471_0507770 [Cutaneotrichosporon sp. HIS471]
MEIETREMSSKPVDLVAARRMYAKTANLIMLWKDIYARWTPEERQAVHDPHCKIAEIQRFLEGAPDTWKEVEYNPLAVSNTGLHAQLESKTAKFWEVVLSITITSELPRATSMWGDLVSIQSRVFDEDMSAQLAAIENSRLSTNDVENALFSTRFFRDSPTTTKGWQDMRKAADLEILAIRHQLNRSHCEIERLNNCISKMPNTDAEGAVERKKAADENHHLQTRLRIALKEIEGLKNAVSRMRTKDKEAADQVKNDADEVSTHSDLGNVKADNTKMLGWFGVLDDPESVTEDKKKLLAREKEWDIKYESVSKEVILYHNLYKDQTTSLENSRAEARKWEHHHGLQVQEAARWQTKYEAEAEKASKCEAARHRAELQVKSLEAALKLTTGDLNDLIVTYNHRVDDLNGLNVKLGEYRAQNEAARAGPSSFQKRDTNPAPRSDPNVAKAGTPPRAPPRYAYQRPINPPGARQGPSAGVRLHPNVITGTSQQAGPSSSYRNPAPAPAPGPRLGHHHSQSDPGNAKSQDAPLPPQYEDSASIERSVDEKRGLRWSAFKL